MKMSISFGGWLWWKSLFQVCWCIEILSDLINLKASIPHSFVCQCSLFLPSWCLVGRQLKTGSLLAHRCCTLYCTEMHCTAQHQTKLHCTAVNQTIIHCASSLAYITPPTMTIPMCILYHYSKKKL